VRRKHALVAEKGELLMRVRTIATALAMSLLAAGWSSAKDSPTDKREKIRKMASQTLADLYKLHPAAQGAVAKSAGYAVFSNRGVNVLLLSTAHGGGLAVDSQSKQETFMKMISVGAGIGAGVKDFRVIFVFETEKALAGFIKSGWDAAGQADAAAKAGKEGGAYSGATSVAPDVWVYQITKSGLALQATLQGTKYSKDDALNKQ
jgi:lipid-binding SYLF domain-containing protein